MNRIYVLVFGLCLLKNCTCAIILKTVYPSFVVDQLPTVMNFNCLCLFVYFVYLLFYLSITSLLWTVCPCFAGKSVLQPDKLRRHFYIFCWYKVFFRASLEKPTGVSDGVNPKNIDLSRFLGLTAKPSVQYRHIKSFRANFLESRHKQEKYEEIKRKIGSAIKILTAKWLNRSSIP